MRYRKNIPVEDAVASIQNEDVIASSGYGGSGFMRLKLGKELGQRQVSSHVYETRSEASGGLRSGWTN